MTTKNILVFDTATIACSVAISTERGVFSRHIEQANSHSQQLLDMIQSVLKEAEISFDQLDFITVGTGPGSFTGLRIGIGIAQALAYSHNIPIITLSTLEMIALNCQNALNSNVTIASDQHQEGIIHVALDARMKEVYYAAFRFDSNQSSRLTITEEIQLITPDQLSLNETSQNNSSNYFCGNGWLEYADKFSILSLPLENIIDIYWPQSDMTVNYIEKHLNDIETIEWKDLKAEYVRNDVAKKSSEKTLI